MRSCNGCVECCNGNLTMDIYGQKVEKGSPCRFISNSGGCSIYKGRPQVCKTFKCLWLTDPSIPNNLYPKESGIVIYKKFFDDYEIYATQEFWGTLSQEDEENVINWYKNKKVNGVIVKKDELKIFGFGNLEELKKFKRTLEGAMK